ncbi:MAG TPA: hypothetical protein VHY08_19200 [Bacillota bacterium]|nr:hypothetical protein [Bacillota bacterium]
MAIEDLTGFEGEEIYCNTFPESFSNFHGNENLGESFSGLKPLSLL